MAVFGVPAAHENDPDRAVRAALRMLEVARIYAAELEEQWQIPGYQIRLGISTGLIAISGSEGEEELSGATINLAARLEAAADPGTILISHGTYQHVRGAFDLQRLDPIAVKGFPDPAPVYRILAARPRSFRSRRRGIETRMVGREGELGALQNVYRTVIEKAEHRAATVVGEAGIGKSRLLYEFENWIDLQPGRGRTLFHARAQPERRILPYAFLRDLFVFRFNIQDDDSYESVLIRARRSYHYLIADWLIEQSSERSGEVVGLIALHLQHAGRLEEALVYLRQAARQAAQLFALVEALHFFDQAVELVESNEEVFGGGELVELRRERGELGTWPPSVRYLPA